MLNLPKSTEFDKRIPKQKFYENMEISPALKKNIVEQIKIVYWRNKISPDTVNLSNSESIEEIEVFEIRLNQQSIDENILKQIDKVIPYQILYVLEYKKQYQLCIAYKEIGDKSNKVNRYFYTEWKNLEDFSLSLDGLSIESVYEGFVKAVAGNQLESDSESLKESIELDEKKTKLKKEMAKLEAKLRKEKQFNKQVEINEKLKKLKKELVKFG